MRLSFPLVFAAFVLVSCHNSNENKIIIGIPEGPTIFSFIKMMNDSLVIDGKAVEFVIKSDPLQLQAMMMRGETDFAVLPTVMAANLYNKGIDYRLLAIPIWGTLYIMSNDAEIQEIKDLKHQTISIFGQGTTADILFRNYAKKNELDDIRIDYSHLSNQEAAFSLMSHTTRTAIISEPLASYLVTRQPNIRIISRIVCEDSIDNDLTNIFAQTAFLVKNTFLEKNKETVLKIMDMYAESCNNTTLYPEKTARLLVRHGFQNDINTAEFSIPLCNIQYAESDQAKEKILRYLQIFYDFKPESLGGKIPADRFIVDRASLLSD